MSAADLSELVGRELPAYTFPAERGKVIEFARAVKTDDPVHLSVTSAVAAGFPDVVAPPTFTAVSAHWTPPSNNVLGLDLRRVLAAGGEWEYHRPIVAGETVTVTGRVSGVEYKASRRGGITFLTLEHILTGADGDRLVTWRTIIGQLDAAPAEKGESA